MNEFEREVLEAHNQYRALHGCPPLQLSRELCNYANEWAQHLACKNTMQHRTNNRYGENLYMSCGMGVCGKTAVKNWYDEIRMHNYCNANGNMSTGHFTQVIWKSSTELGVAVATKGNSVWVVANYDPPGNFMGRYIENVPRPN